MTRVLIDVDGPLGDFVKPYLDTVYECTGRRYQPGDLKLWDLASTLELTSDEVRRVHTAITRRGFCASIRPLPGAFEAVEALQELADVRIVTTPLQGSVFWVSERTEWLARYFGIKPDQIHFCERKHEVRGDLLIDDNPDHVRRFPGRALLWSLPHNASETALERVSSWSDVLQVVAGITQLPTLSTVGYSDPSYVPPHTCAGVTTEP
jgi:5'(3')-deoxyribonucleotidase